MDENVLSTRCVIAGGGPAGMMAGFLLARAGVDVIVLEKHQDFLRDFRGDTIHPSTLNLMRELGVLDEFLQLPHQKVYHLEGWIGETRAPIADFSSLPLPCNYIAMMPQWDFLNFLARKAADLPRFKLIMRAEARDLVVEGDKVVGLTARLPDRGLTIRADLVIAADGRHSILPDEIGLKTIDIGAPMDVLWFRVPRRDGDDEELLGRFVNGRVLIRIFRGDYWQCGYVIAKGAFDEVKARGIEAFRDSVAQLMQLPRARLDAIESFDSVKLLSVAVDRLERWRKPGFLAIGDAAHAMSPVGGVGINLAVQDAVAAANMLAGPILDRTLSENHLAAVERRRLFAVRLIQRGQVAIQNLVIARALSSNQPLKAPLLFRVVSRSPWLRGLMARLVGIGIKPEHIRPVPPPS
jgi:2-polyprenyl-6-methoxyphenol hydroxylase-like FAD-dependent oxidoreductase